jgi:thioredoxin 1
MRYQVMSIPLLLFFKGGQKVDESLGALPESMIRPKVEALL